MLTLNKPEFFRAMDFTTIEHMQLMHFCTWCVNNKRAKGFLICRMYGGYADSLPPHDREELIKAMQDYNQHLADSEKPRKLWSVTKTQL